MLYASPNTPNAKLAFKAQYDNFINGRFVAPVKGQYFDVITPISGQVYTRAARSGPEDIELALDAAHAASAKWAATSAAERANILLKIADRIEANTELLAYAETVDNGKPIRETLNADIPLSADHFRYFAGCLRAQEGALSQIDDHTVAYHFHEPLGVVGQIIPWNFPILMAAWKLAPALGAGNCVVLKPAESTPISILVLTELIADLLPPGVLNIVNGYGKEAGMPLATSKRIAKIAFTGSTATGRVIAQAAATNLIPATLELGGKSPNVFFDDVMAADDAFLDKAIEGMVLFAFNQGEVCTCPSRAPPDPETPRAPLHWPGPGGSNPVWRPVRATSLFQSVPDRRSGQRATVPSVLRQHASAGHYGTTFEPPGLAGFATVAMVDSEVEIG